MYDITEIEASEDISETDIINLRNLYRTPVGTIPMEREKGIDMGMVSMPPETAKNLFAVEVIKKTRSYFNLEVTDIVFTEEEDGKITAKVVVSSGE